MNYFIERYFKILSKLEKYKKSLLTSSKKNPIYNKSINDIDDLLLQKYIKIEEFLNDLY